MGAASEKTIWFILPVLVLVSLYKDRGLLTLIVTSNASRFNGRNQTAASNTTVSSYLEWSEHEQRSREFQLLRSKSDVIPEWMSNYVDWHQDQRRILARNDNATAIHEMKFMVVRCIEKQKCGGLSDRLKPLPAYLMIADLTKRVLLFHWTKPARLEAFFQPPVNGLDWRIEGTPVSEEEVRDGRNFVNGHTDSFSREVRVLAGILDGGDRAFLQTCKVLNILLDGGQQIVSARDTFNRWRAEPGQSTPSWSEDAYLGWKNGANLTKHELLEDTFRLLFEPSPQLSEAIFDMMNHLDILNTPFDAVQVRAKDPREIPLDAIQETFDPDRKMSQSQLRDQAWKLDMKENGYQIGSKMEAYFEKKYKNAIACLRNASNSSDVPVYLASDSMYGYNVQKTSGLPIRIPSWKGDPLHIDSDEFQGRNPEDFYQTFIDTFVMQKARCYSHSEGFGLLPLRLNANLSNCEVAHTKVECNNGDR